jgi:hypothetical protein
MPTLTQATFMFQDSDDWRRDRLAHIVNNRVPDSDLRLTYIDIFSEAYPLALSTAFEFVSRNHDGRYRDRTVMSLRRWALSMAGTDIITRTSERSATHDRKFPILIAAESPFSYDENTETKNGGLAGMLIAVHDGDDDWRGLLVTSKRMRQQKIASCLVSGFSYIAGVELSYYAHSQNFVAARTAASLEYIPVAINSQTGVIQYRRL